MKRKIIQDILILAAALFSVPTLFLLIISRIEMGVWMYFLVALFIMILLGCIVRLIYKRILKPISILRKETEIISQGDLSHNISYRYDDEIGQFIAAFDDMRHKLYLKQKEQEQFEIDRKEFIDSISHDLRTPIASISAYVEALQDGVAQTQQEQEDYLRVIRSKIDILQELSNQLSLTYQTKDLLFLNIKSISPLDWSKDFIERVTFECQTRKINLTIQNHLVESCPSVIKIDPSQLDRALQNILENAYRFSDKVLNIDIDQVNEFLVIKIENDGVTIDKSQLGKIFQRFYTDNYPNVEGHLGLGLFIADTIISAMNGHINAKIDKTMITFNIKLPYYSS